MTPEPRNIPEGQSPLGQQQLKPNLGPLKVGDGATPAPRQPHTRHGAPVAEHAVPTTVRFDPDEATEIDMWVIALRSRVGRRIDKAEAVRELLRAARVPDSDTGKELIRRLRDSS